jgi:PAS domain S-box-containing protein
MNASLLKKKKGDRTRRKFDVDYERIIESSPIATCICDNRGHLRYINRAFAKLTGFGKRSIDSLTIDSFLALNSKQTTSKRDLRDLFSTPQGKYDSATLYGKNKKPKAVQMLACKIAPESKAKLLLLHIIPFQGNELLAPGDSNKIRGEKKNARMARKLTHWVLEPSEQECRQILEKSSIGIVVASKNQLLFANQACENIVGYKYKEILDAQDNNFPGSKEYANLWKNARARLRGKDIPSRYSTTLTTKTGETRYIDVDAQVSDLDGQPVVIATFVDVSDRKKAEMLLQQRADQLHALHSISHTTSQSLDLDDIFDLSLKSTLALMRAEAGVIYLLNENKDVLTIVKSVGIAKSTVDKIKVLNREKCKTWEAVLSGEPVFVADTQSDNGVYQPIKSLGPLSFVIIPLKAKGSVVGTMNIGCRHAKEFNVMATEILTSIGNQIGVAIDNARLLQAKEIEYAERHRTEEALRESETLYRTLAETAQEIIIILDKKGRIQFLNGFAASLFDSKPIDLIGKSNADFFPEDVVSRQIKNIRKAFRKGKAIYVENQIPCRNTLLWLGTWLTPIKNAAGKSTSVLCISRDISEQKQAEQALKESEQRYRSLFEDSAISLWAMDFSRTKNRMDALQQSGAIDFRKYYEKKPTLLSAIIKLAKIVDVNKATLKLFRAASKQELFKSLKSLSDENNLEFLKEAIISFAEGKFNYEGEVISHTLDGTKIILKARFSVNPESEHSMSRVLISVVDISDQKMAEEALKESERRFRDIIERSIDGYFFINKEGKIEYVNSSFLGIFGYSRKEIIGKEFQLLAYQEMQNLHKSVFTKTMGGKTISWQEVNAIRNDGNDIWVALNVRRVIRDGIVLGIEGFIKDITRQKIAEENLRKSEARYRALFESIPNEVFGINSRGQYREMNRDFLLNWGNFIGKTPRKAITDPFVADFMSKLTSNALATRSSIAEKFKIEKESGTVYYQTILNPIITTNDQILGLVGQNINITDQVLAIEQTQSLAASLVKIQEEERARIAREIHDSLGQYLTALQLEIGAAAFTVLGDQARITKILLTCQNTIEQAINAAHDLCYTLRPPLLDDFGLVAALKDYISEFAKQWNINVSFKHHKIDGPLLQSVEISLFRVTQEALRNVLKHAKASKVEVELSRRDHHLLLAIKDNGIGFNVEELGKKAGGGRFGIIGMKERVEMLGGRFSIEASESSGTRIAITVPIE